MPSSPAVSHTVSPDRIQFRMVLTDGSGGTTLADREGKQYVLGPVVLDGTKVQSAQAEYLQDYGSWSVNVRLTSSGSAAFADITTKNVNGQMAIVVDDVVVSAPTIQAPIVGGSVEISGRFTQQEATELANHITGRG